MQKLIKTIRNVSVALKKMVFRSLMSIFYVLMQENEDVFNCQLNFDVHLIRLDCSTSWVERKLIDTVNLLRSDIFPKPSLNCEYCNYLKKRWQLSIT